MQRRRLRLASAAAAAGADDFEYKIALLYLAYQKTIVLVRTRQSLDAWTLNNDPIDAVAAFEPFEVQDSESCPVGLRFNLFEPLTRQGRKHTCSSTVFD